jgi:hypothetical protein
LEADGGDFVENLLGIPILWAGGHGTAGLISCNQFNRLSDAPKIDPFSAHRGAYRKFMPYLELAAAERTVGEAPFSMNRN